MGARQYSPRLGRFLETDPITGGSANPYAYTYGDPNNTNDVTGKCPECGWLALVSAYYGPGIEDRAIPPVQLIFTAPMRQMYPGDPSPYDFRPKLHGPVVDWNQLIEAADKVSHWVSEAMTIESEVSTAIAAAEAAGLAGLVVCPIVSSVTFEAAAPACETAMIWGGGYYGYVLGKNGPPDG